MTIGCRSRTYLFHIKSSSSLVAASQHYPPAPADSEWFIMSSGNSGSGVRCPGDGGWRVSSVPVQPGQCPVLPTVGAGVWEVPCSQPRVPSLLCSVPGVCQSPPPSLDLSGLPPPSALTLGAGARAGAGLNWPLCPLRWTQIRGPAQRTDRQYNLGGHRYKKMLIMLKMLIYKFVLT